MNEHAAKNCHTCIHRQRGWNPCAKTNLKAYLRGAYEHLVPQTGCKHWAPNADYKEVMGEPVLVCRAIMPKKTGGGILLVGLCPYCGQEHTHGGGLDPDNLRMGSRLSHCVYTPRYMYMLELVRP